MHNIRSGLSKFVDWIKPGVKSFLGHAAQAGLDYAQKQLPGAMMTPAIDEDPEVANPTWGYQAPMPHSVWNVSAKKSLAPPQEPTKHKGDEHIDYKEKYDKAELLKMARLLRLAKKIKNAESKQERQAAQSKYNVLAKELHKHYGISEGLIRNSPRLHALLKKLNKKHKLKKPAKQHKKAKEAPKKEKKSKKHYEEDEDEEIEEFVKIKKDKYEKPHKKVSLKDHKKDKHKEAPIQKKVSLKDQEADKKLKDKKKKKVLKPPDLD
jgi:hypothetical protein